MSYSYDGIVLLLGAFLGRVAYFLDATHVFLMIHALIYLVVLFE